MYIAEIVSVTVDDAHMNENGKFLINELGLVMYSHGEYFSMGEKLGKFGYSIQKK
jgi:flavin reductase (DIM6/NTAB) family NADH-FMN oxidoreductase RutF